jgi:N-acyl-L-homoserine lactone synthetase
MISCITCENAHLFGSAFHSQFQLRYRAFIERQDYDVRIYKGMEYDQYDTPASHYLVYHTPDGRALGVSRLTPTTQGCILKDLWPNMVEDKEILDSAQVWEGTRYCIDKDVEPALRTTIIYEMAIAYLEFGLRLGLQKIVGMMPTYIYRSVFEKPGISMEYLGPVTVIGRHRIRAVAIPVDPSQLHNVRAKTGISETVLTFLPTTQEGGLSHDKAA